MSDPRAKVLDDLERDLENALRCSADIEDQGLRARYLAAVLTLRGYIVVRREPRTSAPEPVT